MASTSVLSEDSFLCSICLDLFSQPVTTPCGHSFCKACLTKYWDSSDTCHCPMCKKAFDPRLDLSASMVISEVVAYFKKSKLDAPILIPEEEVPCDICSDTKIKAVKSCLSCVASYCETHLEPHHRVASLKTHKLVDPVKLEDRLCKEHGRMLELFCRRDQKYICLTCSKTDHKDHDTVLIEVEYKEKRPQLDKERAEVEKMIQERQEKIQKFRVTVEKNNITAENEKADTVQVCSALVSSIKRTEAELIQVIELKVQSATREAEGLIRKLEEEITELQRKSIELEQLSHTEDHLHLLQNFPSHYSVTHMSKLSDVKLSCEVSVKSIHTAISQLQETLDREMEKLPEVMLKKIQQQYAVDVTLDPDTAHPNLVLSLDGKQVKYGNVKRILPEKSQRFDKVPCVLGKERFSSGKVYYEVQLKPKAAWTIGVVPQDISRKNSCLSGVWYGCSRTLQVVNGGNYSAQNKCVSPDSVKIDVQKIGVFLDYKGKQVSFYDVETRAFLYCRCLSDKTIYLPFFSPLIPDADEEASPLIISPVKQNFDVTLWSSVVFYDDDYD